MTSDKYIIASSSVVTSVALNLSATANVENDHYIPDHTNHCLASVLSIALAASFCCTIITHKQTYDHC